MDIYHILHTSPDGEALSFACLINSVRITKTKKGDLMALLKVRDYTGAFEVAVFPEVFKKVKSLCVLDATVVIKGKTTSRNGERTLIVDTITPLITPVV